MDFYSNSKPNLISDNIKNLILQENTNIHDSPDITSNFHNKIYNLICNNIEIIFLLACIIAYLYYRYKNKSEHMNDLYNRPTLNPYYPLDNQVNYGIYKEDEPNIPGHIMKNVYPNYGIQQNPQLFQNPSPQNLPNNKQYNYSAFINPYKEYENDNPVMNQLGYLVNQNKDYNNFSSYMTELNKKNIMDMNYS